MPIKNYTTKVPAPQTISEIQGILACHGARKIMIDYGDSGEPVSITFGVVFNGVMLSYRLDAKPEGVLAVMKKDKLKCDEEQAKRIAWRNLKDWISAQVALVETNQATMQELFLPQMMDRSERTLYEVFQNGQLMLEDGRRD